MKVKYDRRAALRQSVCRVENLELRCFLSATPAAPAAASTVATIGATAGNTAQANSRRVYMIGNSLTDAVNYDAFDALLSTAGSVQLGRQTGPGFPLAANYDLNSGYITSGYDPADPTNHQPYGNYQNAFANFAWDDLTLQTNERHLTNETFNGENQAEVPMTIKFMDALAVNSPHAQVFVYQRPVRRTDVDADLQSTGETNNYSQEYLKTYNDSTNTDNEYYSRSFFQQLLPLVASAKASDSALNSMPTVKIIPAAEAWYNIDQAIRAGKFNGTGITDIKDFYADQSHPTGLGAYALGLTFYSAVTGNDPRGHAPTAGYISQDSRLSNTTVQTIIENAVYKAMTSSSFSGYMTTLGAPTSTTPDPDPGNGGGGGGGGGTSTGGTGSIRVTAYTDNNGNGLYDSGDDLKSGVVVYIDANGDGALDNGETQATTNSAGRATFSDVAVGTYSVRGVTGSAAISQSIAQQLISVTKGKTRALSLGVVPSSGVPLVGEGSSTLRGYVVRDVNADGLPNGKDVVMKGVTVWIDLNRDGKIQSYEPTTTSNSRGKYIFSDLPAGTYPIRQVVRTGWQQTAPTARYADAFTVLAHKTRVVSFLASIIPPTASIAGNVTNDVNGNDLLDPTDVGLRGRTVYLDLNNDGEIESDEPSTTTVGRGAYKFSALSAGSYVIREILPAGWTYAGTAAVAALQLTLSDGQAVTGQVILNKQT